MRFDREAGVSQVRAAIHIMSEVVTRYPAYGKLRTLDIARQRLLEATGSSS